MKYLPTATRSPLARRLAIAVTVVALMVSLSASCPAGDEASATASNATASNATAISATASNATSATTPAPATATPLATSVNTADGTWATVPMGRLDQPLNTFWQLLFRPRGAASWTNEVEATATATNGGLVLASSGDRSLLVGVRPSVDLTFTPLIATADGASSWSTGLITSALADRPDALAMSPGGQALAITRATTTTAVLSSPGNLSKWRPVASLAALKTASRRCDLEALSAVGFGGDQALVGGSCARPGVVGLLSLRSGHWHLAGPELPADLSPGRAEVLALSKAAGGTGALIAVSLGDITALVGAWTRPDGRWSLSAPLQLGPGQQVASFGTSPDGGLFVLTQDGPGHDNLMLTDRGHGQWTKMAAPPLGTETVAFPAGSPPQALVASSPTLLDIWSLVDNGAAWRQGQVIHVPVQYGSSS